MEARSAGWVCVRAVCANVVCVCVCVCVLYVYARSRALHVCVSGSLTLYFFVGFLSRVSSSSGLALNQLPNREEREGTFVPFHRKETP